MLENEHVHLILRNRREADLDRPSEIHFRAVYLCRTVCHHAPAALTGEARRGRVRKDHVPRRGIDAIGSHHQVEAPGTTITEPHVDSVGILCEVGDGNAQSDIDIGVADAPRHQFVQNGPHDAAARMDRLGIGRSRNLSDQRAVRVFGAHARPDKAVFADGGKQAECVERAQRKAGDGDACTVHPPFRIRIDQRDGDAYFGKRKCGSHAADPTADNQH